MICTSTRLTVLHVEDEPADRLLIARALRDSVDLRAVGTLDEALHELVANPVDVLLLDLHLPDAEGLDLVRLLNEAAPLAAIVVLTGSFEEGLSVRAARAGAHGFLVKGEFGPALLRRTLLDAKERKAQQVRYEESRRRLERVAVRDPLTGALNRRGLKRCLEAVSAPVTALLIDVDDFKAINTEWGHAGGDAALIAISRQLRASVRPDDPVCRIGGDEFLVVLPETDAAEGRAVAERLRRTIGDTVLPRPGGELRLGVSVGLHTLREAPRSVAELISATQFGLRDSKATGKFRVVAVGDEARPREERAGVVELISGEGLTVLEQPIVWLRSGAVWARERFVRGPGDLERPSDLFHAARDESCLTVVDLEALRRCVTAGRRQSTRLHLNVFPETLVRAPSDVLRELLVPAGGPQVCVELSERELLAAPPDLRARLCSLQAEGVEFALDHIGFGASSLESLIDLQPRLLKIDRAWTVGLAAEPAKRQALGRLRSVARALDLELIATGVETEPDRDALERLGIELAQGYLWGAPRRVHEVR